MQFFNLTPEILESLKLLMTHLREEIKSDENPKPANMSEADKVQSDANLFDAESNPDSEKSFLPWLDPAVMQDHKESVRYSFKMTPELYQKILWIISNMAGYRSIQVFLAKSVETEANRILEELGVV